MTELQIKREATVRAHMAAENNHDVEATLQTFHHPRYEVIPFGGASDGTEAVHGLLSALMTAFPDFRVEPVRLYHAGDCVIVETRMTGTQKGDWLGMPASGKGIDLMAACFFQFEEDRLMCERVYFDNATMVRQLS